MISIKFEVISICYYFSDNNREIDDDDSKNDLNIFIIVIIIGIEIINVVIKNGINVLKNIISFFFWE